MKRLTKIDGVGNNDIIRCFDCNEEIAGENLENCGMCDHWQAVFDKLAAYEDTGLESEEVGALLKLVSFCGSCEYFGDADMGGFGTCRKLAMMVGCEEHRPECFVWNREGPSC